MKDLATKADKGMLKAVTYCVRTWMAWHENKKHAIDFLLQFEYLQLGVLILWAILLPTALFVREGHIVSAIVHTLIWSCLATFEWSSIRQTKYMLKPQHDFIFNLKEEPEYVKMHAEMLAELFEKTRERRLKNTVIIMSMTCVLFLIAGAATSDPANNIVWQYLFVNALANRTKEYVLYVNDMEPPKKKKKASEKISELVERLWGELTGGFTPQPAFG